MTEAVDELKKRILALNERVWEGRMSWPKVEQWLENFTGKVADPEQEQLHALYWLSQFMYFGAREIRVMLRAMYRDLYFTPMVQDVRDKIGRSCSDFDLEAAVKDEIKHTCFIGVGNPSESGVHLLYYFRQENKLSKKRFSDAVQIFSRSATPVSYYFPFRSWLQSLICPSHDQGASGPLTLRDPSLRRYIFLDDICGSGDTAIDYSRQVLGDLLKLKPDAQVAYLSLFATEKGLECVRRNTLFGNDCSAVFELDASYQCLSHDSRYLSLTPDYIDPDLARRIVREYGELLNPDYACGYKNSELLLGFHHNTPDNTLAIIWWDSPVDSIQPWHPAFKRYPKIYGEGA